MAEASLIPKKLPSAPPQFGAGLGVFFRIAFIFFLVALLATVVLFLYRKLLISNLTKNFKALTQLELQFPVKDIEKREELARTINSSKKILASHVRQSLAFSLIQENTLPTIFYNNFSFSEKDHSLSVSGEAPSYQAVAQQASLFEKPEEVKSATFSNLSLSQRGTVNFNLKIILSGSFGPEDQDSTTETPSLEQPQL